MATIESLFPDLAPKARGGKVMFTLDDPVVARIRDLPIGFVSINLGDDPNGPLAQIQYLEPDLEFPPHFHNSDYVTFVLQGSLLVGRTWCHAGHVRVQDKGSVYGPSKAGPEGVLTVTVYTDRTALPDQFVNERDAAKAAAMIPYILGRFAEAGATIPDVDLNSLPVVAPADA